MNEIIPKSPNLTPLWAWFSVFEIDAAFYIGQWNQVTSGISNMKKTFPSIFLVRFVIKTYTFSYCTHCIYCSTFIGCSASECAF